MWCSLNQRYQEYVETVRELIPVWLDPVKDSPHPLFRQTHVQENCGRVSTLVHTDTALYLPHNDQRERLSLYIRKNLTHSWIDRLKVTHFDGPTRALVRLLRFGTTVLLRSHFIPCHWHFRSY